jgi:hypothetical protein
MQPFLRPTTPKRVAARTNAELRYSWSESCAIHAMGLPHTGRKRWNGNIRDNSSHLVTCKPWWL